MTDIRVPSPERRRLNLLYASLCGELSALAKAQHWFGRVSRLALDCDDFTLEQQALERELLELAAGLTEVIERARVVRLMVRRRWSATP